MFAPSIWSAIYKIDFLKSRNIKLVENVKPYEDLPFAYEVYSKNAKVVLINEPLYFYRCEEKQNNSTCRNDKKLFAVIAQINTARNILKTNNMWDIGKEAFYKHLYNVTILFVYNARKDLKKSLFEQFSIIAKEAEKENILYKYFNSDEIVLEKKLEKNEFEKFRYCKILKYAKIHLLFLFKKDFWALLKDL